MDFAAQRSLPRENGLGALETPWYAEAAMAYPMTWRKSWRVYLVPAGCLIYGSATLIRTAFDPQLEPAVHTLFGWMAALTIPALLFAPFALWLELRSWKHPAVALESDRLTLWGVLVAKPTVIPLDDLVRVEWESWGTIAFRVKSGEVRPILLAIGKTAREEFLAALRNTLAERRAA